PAFLAYLDKLESVARLEVVGAYYDVKPGHNKEHPNSDLHVIARTFNEPRSYWYRKRVDEARWTPWEQVDVGLEGDHIVPVVWMGNPQLYWLTFVQRSEDADLLLKLDKTTARHKTYWELKLAFAEKKQDAWTAKELVAIDIDEFASAYQQYPMISMYGYNYPPNPEPKEKFLLGVEPDGRRLGVMVRIPSGDDIQRSWFWASWRKVGRLGRFDVAGTARMFNEGALGKSYQAHKFMGTYIDPLKVFSPTTTDRRTGNPITLLEPMPRREVWSLVVAGSPAVYDYDYSGFTDVEWRYAIVDPMFYQDTSRSYFVSPKSYFDWAGYLASPKRDEESYWVDGSQFA